VIESSVFKPSTRRPTSRIDYLWLPLGMPIVFFLIDNYFIPWAFMLPLMLLMFLIYLSFRVHSGIVAFWGTVYAATVFILSFLPIQDVRQADPALRPYLRLAFFAVGTVAATLVANNRGRMEKSHQALLSLVTSLPVAVVVSDISGNILLLNNEARRMLSGCFHELSGLSFFSTFVSPDDQGKAIANYISYFDSHHEGPIKTTLRTRGERSLALRASITVISLDANRYAMTMIEAIEEPAKISA